MGNERFYWDGLRIIFLNCKFMFDCNCLYFVHDNNSKLNSIYLMSIFYLLIQTFYKAK